MNMAGPPGKNRLLDAAERLFAEQGIEATSARAINAAADLSPAALHYHFGNKEKIVEEVLRRRMGVLNEHRIAILTAATEKGTPLDGTALAELIVRPLTDFALGDGKPGRWYVRFLSRLYSEKAAMILDFLEQNFADGVRMFDEMVCAAVPDLGMDEVRCRRVIAGEAATHTIAHIVEFVIDAENGQEMAEPFVRSMIAFLAGGLTAPAPRP